MVLRTGDNAPYGFGGRTGSCLSSRLSPSPPRRAAKLPWTILAFLVALVLVAHPVASGTGCGHGLPTSFCAPKHCTGGMVLWDVQRGSLRSFEHATQQVVSAFLYSCSSIQLKTGARHASQVRVRSTCRRFRSGYDRAGEAATSWDSPRDEWASHAHAGASHTAHRPEKRARLAPPVRAGRGSRTGQEPERDWRGRCSIAGQSRCSARHDRSCIQRTQTMGWALPRAMRATRGRRCPHANHLEGNPPSLSHSIWRDTRWDTLHPKASPRSRCACVLLERPKDTPPRPTQPDPPRVTARLHEYTPTRGSMVQRSRSLPTGPIATLKGSGYNPMYGHLCHPPSSWPLRPG